MVVLAVALFAVAVSGAAPGDEASIKNFQQCSNDAPPSAATDCPGGWINGILNNNNSHYAEDDVTPQRVILVLPKGGPLTGRTIEINYQARKGGVHAYDSLATWNHTQTTADRCSDLNPADCVGGSASTFAIPADPTVVADNNGSGTATSGHQLSGQVMTMYGGTITGVSVPTHTDPGGTGDEDASLVVTYDVPDLSQNTKVMLLFGGHIAPSTGPRGWGVGVGAGSISGGPYHISICNVDGVASGCRDNQIQSGAILAPANLLIEKVAVGGDGTFDYTSTGGLSPASFPITTSSGSGSQAFANITPGTYTVTESAPPAGWDFTSLDCVDEDGNSSESGATGTIVLAAGETATCTYTNTKRGSIVIDKVTAPSGDLTSFPFTLSGGPDQINQGFSLTDAATPHDSGLVRPGTYAASETTVPAGWDLTSATCSDGSSPSSIDLAAGETVTCTFTNTKRGNIIVEKQTNPDGDPQSFDFTASYDQGGFSLSDGQQNNSGLLLPGNYSVSETVPAGWDLESATCDDGSSPDAIGLDPAETITCTFTNTKQSHLIVIKTVVNDNGGSAVSSDWTMNVAGPTPLSFQGAAAPGTSNQVDPGDYTVTESGPAGYALSYSGDCDANGNVTVPLGETRTCTLTNDDQAASLTIVKELVNDNGGTKQFTDFSFDVAGPTASSDTFFDADGSVTLGVSAGTYTVTEDQANLDGYTTSYTNCAGVVIPLGGSATCTIRNDDNAPSLTLVKEVVNDNGGTAQPSDWTLTADGPTGFSGPGPSAASGAGFDAGSYDLSEAGPAGYDASDWVCTGGQVDADTVAVALGADITCTITNNDQRASLTVIKHVVNDNGGTAVAADFAITVTGSNPNPASFPGAEDPGTTVAIEPGAYNVTEVEDPDYAASYS
ncbi:MAG TPA: hypothetical protein VFU34_03880, partial [Gaiellaceae bacterium]|nr:hypothetical protein [Gaiellaceae bacterium]